MVDEDRGRRAENDDTTTARPRCSAFARIPPALANRHHKHWATSRAGQRAAFFPRPIDVHACPGTRPCPPRPTVCPRIKIRLGAYTNRFDQGMSPSTYTEDLRIRLMPPQRRAKPSVGSRHANQIVLPDDKGLVPLCDLCHRGQHIAAKAEVPGALGQPDFTPIDPTEQSPHLGHIAGINRPPGTIGKSINRRNPLRTQAGQHPSQVSGPRASQQNNRDGRDVVDHSGASYLGARILPQKR